MKNRALTAIFGFIVLFILYHAAEYMIVFKNSPLGFLSFQALFFVAAYAIAKWQHKGGLAAWGLDAKKSFLRQLILGMLTGIFMYGLTYFINLLLGTEKFTRVPNLVDTIAPLGLFFFGNFFSSFSEDVLTRGYVYNHLKGKISSWLLIFISATVYLLNHIYRLDDGLIVCTYLFLLGILFVIPLILTKRLWFTGGMHWAGNVTFFYTHEIIKTEEASQIVSPNYILVLVILVFIPLNYLILKAAHFIEEHM